MVTIHEIKLLIFFLACSVIFTGCCGEPGVEQIVDSANIKSVVSNYLSAEQNGDFTHATNFLTGEALAEANINFNRKQIQKKYLSIKLSEKIITPELTTIYADITAQYSEPFFNFVDRYALNFYLIRQDERWLIYKVGPTAIKRPVLTTGEIPTGAKELLENYFSMPYELKKYHELDYLAGQALNIFSQVNNNYRQNPPTTISRGFKVQEIKSVGYSDGYCIAKVTYSGGNNDTTITAMVDLINVAGQWKITRLDITGQERGD